MRTLQTVIFASVLGSATGLAAGITLTLNESQKDYFLAMGVQVNSGKLILCEQFDDPQALNKVCTGQNISDVIVFAGAAPAQISFFSDVETGEQANAADVGIPNPLPAFGTTTKYELEPGGENALQQFTYLPRPGALGDPGGSLDPDPLNQQNTYLITSDTPEPSTMAVMALLMLCGISVSVYRHA